MNTLRFHRLHLYLLALLALPALLLVLPAPLALANDGIVFESETVVVHPDDKGISVHTILHAVNAGASPQQAVWELPEGASELQILVGESDVINVGGKKLQRKEALSGGGDFTIVYRYRYPYPAGSKRFALPLSYPAQTLQILLPADNQQYELAADGLSKTGPTDFQGTSYFFYRAGSLQAGVYGIDVRSAAGTVHVPPFHSKKLIELWQNSVLRSVNPHLLAAIVAVVIGIGVYLGYDAFRKRKGAAEWTPDAEEQRFLDLYRQKQILFEKLAALQQRIDEEGADDGELVRLKAGYKEKIVDVQMELNKLIS
ncbi:hypothetical protein B5M42_019820 [Paenibacillus athensensis]|uniref:Uncharacterized protein n=1 Tax=Paenibacillus athensensis TaxID=1967502 RepID=A0A4Y8Q1Y6_9BACL|nr:hypothetical protein [Paenibacillus athensensis]MCD1261056.1 hypothetical protein [Paenibacillus athensensis]